MENNLKTVTSSSGPALLQGQPGTSEDASPLERCDMTNGTNGSENGWVMVSYTSQIHPNSLGKHELILELWLTSEFMGTLL